MSRSFKFSLREAGFFLKMETFWAAMLCDSVNVLVVNETSFSLDAKEVVSTQNGIMSSSCFMILGFLKDKNCITKKQ